jgi:hypothetical protein
MRRISSSVSSPLSWRGRLWRSGLEQRTEEPGGRIVGNRRAAVEMRQPDKLFCGILEPQRLPSLIVITKSKAD